MLIQHKTLLILISFLSLALINLNVTSLVFVIINPKKKNNLYGTYLINTSYILNNLIIFFFSG